LQPPVFVDWADHVTDLSHRCADAVAQKKAQQKLKLPRVGTIYTTAGEAFDTMSPDASSSSGLSEESMIKKLAAAFVIAASSIGFMSASASAGVIINFIELPNETGIRVTGIDAGGAAFDVTKAGSEAFYISSPLVPGGYSPDLILSHIGISRVSPGYLFALLESAGGPVSDYVWVHQFIPAFTVIDFISDSEAALLLPTTPLVTLVETGDLQFVGSYLNDKGETVSLSVLSDAPEPGTLAIIAAGFLSLFAFGLMRRRANV
jgi:hypothetical protein